MLYCNLGKSHMWPKHKHENLLLYFRIENILSINWQS